MMTTREYPPPPALPPDCVSVRAMARDAILASARKELPQAALAHARGCPDCRGEILELTQFEALIADTLGKVRQSTPDPSPDRVESIVAELTSRPPQARLLSRIRRTVNWMLWLTLLALSLLALVYLSLWILRLLEKVE